MSFQMRPCTLSYALKYMSNVMEHELSQLDNRKKVLDYALGYLQPNEDEETESDNNNKEKDSTELMSLFKEEMENLVAKSLSKIFPQDFALKQRIRKGLAGVSHKIANKLSNLPKDKFIKDRSDPLSNEQRC